MFKGKKSVLMALTVLVALCSFMLVSVAATSTDLTVWCWSDWEVTLGPFFQETVEKFNKEHPDIKVTLQSFPNVQFNEKILPALATGTGPQMFPVSASIDKYVKADVLEPLPEKYFPKDWLEKNFPSVPRYFDFEGKYYTYSNGAMPWGVFYNKRLWAEAGLTDKDVPRTWDELVTVGKKLTEEDAKGNIIREALGVKGIEFAIINNLVAQRRGYLFSEDLTESLYNSSEVEEAVQFVYDLHYKDKITSAEFPVFIEAWTSELAAMVWVSTFLGGYTDQAVPDLNWGVFPGPLPSNERMPELWSWGVINHQCGLTVSQGATKEQKEAGFVFMRFLMDDPQFLANTAQALSVVPDKIGLLAYPEFQTPTARAISMMVGYGIPMGELITDLMYVVIPKAIDEIILNNAPIKETLDGVKREGDKILAKETGKVRVTERRYNPPSDMSVIENWRSGKIAFPIVK